ncbi:MAG TPA: hypothetical protein VFA01_02750 [Candidatus Dormibacteraeota bacterium]|jgi:hypothetical protein|nr:hypothetical protein [Candidatus Dormibacteraeota bacterium]
MGCLVGLFRFLVLLLWRAVIAAILAILFARVDAYVERRYGSHPAGRAYRAWRGDRIRRGTPPDASSAVEGTVRRDDPRQR